MFLDVTDYYCMIIAHSVVLFLDVMDCYCICLMFPSEVSMSRLCLCFHDSKHTHLQKVLFLNLCLWKNHLCTERTIMDQEWSLVGHLTKLEPTKVSPLITAGCVL